MIRSHLALARGPDTAWVGLLNPWWVLLPGPVWEPVSSKAHKPDKNVPGCASTSTVSGLSVVKPLCLHSNAAFRLHPQSSDSESASSVRVKWLNIDQHLRACQRVLLSLLSWTLAARPDFVPLQLEVLQSMGPSSGFSEAPVL